jgi:deazaflavin-dependent oxidoreductase (nitroreductase family)
MENTDNDLTHLLLSLSGEDYCYLTTKGRISGRAHEIEIWFGVHGDALYLLAGSGEESDWVKNLLKEPAVTVRISEHIFTGVARIVRVAEEDTRARYMLAEKYQEWKEGKTLSDWARTALPVAIDIHNGE